LADPLSKMSSSQDSWYIALLGLAETFRVSKNMKACIKCLQTVFSFKPPPVIEARTHLQLGNILHSHTTNQDLAKHHLEQAWFLSQNLQADDVKFEAAISLAKTYEKRGDADNAKQVINKAMEISPGSPYWHCRLLFALADLHSRQKDLVSANTVLTSGVEYAYRSGANYTRVLFILSKTMLFLAERKFQDANPLLQQVRPDIEAWLDSNRHQAEAISVQQKEYLQMFYLVLQVCYYLMVGQIKSVKAVLKQLQQCIQTITAPGWPADDDLATANQFDQFVWMPKEHLCVLVYLITVMHSMQAGYMDKAQKYTDKAVVQIQKLRQHEESPLLSVFHVLLIEHIIQCRLVVGNNVGAIQEIANICRLLDKNPVLMASHRAQLHTLLGLYSMSMNQMEQAETQLNAALRTSTERELWTFANLNLAIVYLRSRRDQDFMALLDRIHPDRLPSQSHSLKAAAFYIQGLQSFFAAQYNESKRYLRETLKMANAEDLNRLTSCSLVLLGHIFLSLGNTRESMNMVTPAMQLASKIPDVNVQLWAAAILKDLYRMQGDPVREAEGSSMHANFTNSIAKDSFQACQELEHQLINWTDGPFPALNQNTALAVTHQNTAQTY